MVFKRSITVQWSALTLHTSVWLGDQESVPNAD
jgi:hypothetical protein